MRKLGRLFQLGSVVVSLAALPWLWWASAMAAERPPLSPLAAAVVPGTVERTATPAAAEPTRTPAQAGPRVRPGVVLVRYRQDAPLSVRQGAPTYAGVHRVPVPPGEEQAQAEVLARQPTVLYAEPDYIAQALDRTPNDPEFERQWNLRTLRLPAAWDLATGSPAIIVAVVDTGVDLGHPDLAGNIASGGWDFVNGDDNPQDDHGHGTHVAGIVAAVTNNALGVAGVAWQARILPVKVLDRDGDGTSSDVASGIRWAADAGASIISLSLGGPASRTLADAVAYAQQRGALVVAAGGNEYQEGNPTTYPAAYPGVIGVAATDRFDQRAFFSNTGPYIDLAAPGVDIFSTYWGASSSTYRALSGTSMAAPHVAGLAGLVQSALPELTAVEVTEVLTMTAEKVGSTSYVNGRNDEYGYGRIDARAALELVTSTGVRGTVVDGQTGRALDAITVTVTGRSSVTTTTVAGAFTVTVAPGSYQVCAVVAGAARDCRVASVALGSRADSGTLVVTPTVTSQLAFGLAPIRATHGSPFGRQPRVVLRDSAGLTLTTDSVTVVTLSIKPGSGASGAALTCDQTQGGATAARASSGVVAFSGCAIDRPGASYILVATAAGFGPVESPPFNVTWHGDADGDGRVSAVDYSLVVTHYGKSSASADWRDPATRPWRADLDGDERVGVVDYSLVVSFYGTATATAVPPSDGNSPRN